MQTGKSPGEVVLLVGRLVGAWRDRFVVDAMNVRPRTTETVE